MNNNQEDVCKSYEKIANWMDKHRSRELFERPYLDRVIVCLKPGATVLDLGCGTGEPIGQYFILRRKKTQLFRAGMNCAL